MPTEHERSYAPAGPDFEAFFTELPSAVVAYSIAVGAVSLAAIAARVAVNVVFGI